MNIPQIDQDLATIKATHVQFDNGYHLSEADIVAFNQAINRLNAHPLNVAPVEPARNYRTEQIRNRLTTHDSMKLKLTNENSETKWLNITPDEARQIGDLLNTEEGK